MIRRGLRVAAAAGLALAIALAAAPASAIAPARVVVEGVATVGSSAGPLRTAALRDGLRRAVVRIAQDLVRAEGGRLPADQVLGSLEGEPRDYAVRYRVLQDRGERPSAGSGPLEYALDVEVFVDVDRVARSLQAAGRLAALPGELPASAHRMLVETDDWAAYQAFLGVLEGVGEARRVVPETFEDGRVELLVEAPGRASDLLDRVVRHGEPGLDVLAVGSRDDELRVRVRRTRSPAGSRLGND